MLKKISHKNHVKASISIITQFYPPDYAATGQFIYDLDGFHLIDLLQTNLNEHLYSLSSLTIDIETQN